MLQREMNVFDIEELDGKGAETPTTKGDLELLLFVHPRLVPGRGRSANGGLDLPRLRRRPVCFPMLLELLGESLREAHTL